MKDWQDTAIAVRRLIFGEVELMKRFKTASACLLLVSLSLMPVQALAGQVMKTTIDLRLREAPTTASETLEIIPKGTSLDIFSTTGTWAKTSYNSNSGYAGLKYLAPTAQSRMGVVKTTLNLRSAPSLTATILRTIPSYTPIPLYEKSGTWVKTVWSGTIGWVSLNYTKPIDGLPRMKTTTNLRLRTGPSTSYPILKTVPSGTSIPVLTTSNGWVKTWIFGMTGWMSQSYLTSVKFPILRPDVPPDWIIYYSNAKMEWSHTYPQDYHYGYPELDSHYRYSDGKVHLTFDAGFENGLTAGFLDVLKAKNVKARFYLTGTYLRDHPTLVKRMLNEGHQVGNHSWSHPDTVDLMADSIALVYNDLMRWENQYKAAIGQSPARWYYRPPSGIFSERTLGLVHWMGYTTELYQVALRDWDPENQLSPEVTLESLLNQTKQGSIVLLHVVSSSDLEVLGKYIDTIRAKGWSFALP